MSERMFIVSDGTTGWVYLVKAAGPDEAAAKLRASITEDNMHESYLHYVDAIKSLNESIKKTNEMDADLRTRYPEDKIWDRAPYPLHEPCGYEEWVASYDYEIETLDEFVMEGDIMIIEDSVLVSHL